MNNFMATMRLASQGFFKLRRHRPVPAWAMWLMTVLVSLAWGGGLLLLTTLLGNQWRTEGWWLKVAPPMLLTSLAIGFSFHIVYSGIELLASDRFLVWVNGKPGFLVTLFYIGTSACCVAAGLMLSQLLFGQLPGMDRVSFSPERSWLSVAGASVFVSLIWGLAAWQQWHEEQFKRQAQEAQLRLLQAQIEPHFLFNTLANVHSLMDHDLPKAKQMLGSFTDYLRASLGRLRAQDSTVAQEAELARTYLELLQGRMEDRLRFEVEVDAAAASQLIPPLLLQPLVENAIVHGLEPSIAGGTVRLKAHVRGRQLWLEVQDDGLGIDAPPRPGRKRGNGVAVDNIRERLQARYGGEASLTIQANHPGTLARIQIPLPDTAP